MNFNLHDFKLLFQLKMLLAENIVRRTYISMD